MHEEEAQLLKEAQILGIELKDFSQVKTDNKKQRFDLNSKVTQIPLEEQEIKPSNSINAISDRPKTNTFVSPRRNHKLIDLPSKACFYPDMTKIFSTNYLVKEIDTLSIEVDTMDIDFMYETLLQGIYAKGFEKTDITYSDFCFISFERKLDALGDYEVKETVDCPECKKPSNFVFHFESDFEFQDLDSEKLKDLTRKFIFGYVDEFDEYQEIEKVFSFKPLTIGDILDIYRRGLQYNEIAYLVYLIDVPNKHELLESYFNPDAINIEHRKVLQEMDFLLFHGIKSKKVKCKNKIDSTEGGKKVSKTCGHELTIDFDVPSLIFPFSEN